MAVIWLCYCVTLWHMSICARIIIAVSFQKVDYAPDTQTGTEGNYQRLQHIDCTVEKLHPKTRGHAAP